MLQHNTITIYTDGSCNPVYGIGAWAAILFIDDKKIVLTGREEKTTHQRMELTAVIKAIEYLVENAIKANHLIIYADSQYVVRLTEREERLVASAFKSKKKVWIRNDDLMKDFFHYTKMFEIAFVKVKSHTKKSEKQNFNREVDKLSRKIVREYVISRSVS